MVATNENKGESDSEWWSDLFRPISSAAATASGVELKRDSIATSTGKSFFLAAVKPCFASSDSALPRAFVSCRPAGDLYDRADDSWWRQKQRGKVGTRFPSRKHANNILERRNDIILIPSSTIALVGLDERRTAQEMRLRIGGTQT